jgi:hypothetical protein
MDALVAQASILRDLKRQTEAREVAQRALGLVRPAEPDTSLARGAGYALGVLGALDLDAQRWPQAAARFREGLGAMGTTADTDSKAALELRSELAEAYVGMARYADAISMLEAVVKEREGKKTDRTEAAWTKFVLARALSAAGKDRARALRLAYEAQEAYADSPAFMSPERARIDAWISGHAGVAVTTGRPR